MTMTSSYYKKAAFLETMLEHVPFDGWTDTCFYQTAKDLDMVPAAARELFRGRSSEVVDYFMRSIDAEMMLRLEEKELDLLRIRERIKLAVQVRIEILTSYKPAVKRLMSYYSLHPCEATQSIYKTTDTMWHMAGDTSTDYNHYSKRILLGVVYSSTLLYWIDDYSDDHHDTWQFLERRIDNVLSIGKLKSSFKDLPFVRQAF